MLIKTPGCTLCANAQESDQRHREDRENGFPQVNVIPEKRVQPPETEDIAQEIPGIQRKGRGIRPEYGQVGQRRKPGNEEALVIPEDFPGIGVRTAALRVAMHHIVIVVAHQQHDQRTDEQAEYTAHRSGRRKIGIGGHDQGTPSHTGADGKRPGSERGKVWCQFGFVLCMHRQILSPAAGQLSALF